MPFRLTTDDLKAAVSKAYADEPRAEEALEKLLVRRDIRLLREIRKIYSFELRLDESEFFEALDDLENSIRDGEDLVKARENALSALTANDEA